MIEEPKITLYEKSNVYVTTAAADQYAAARGLRQEEARRELTTLLLDATEQANGSWRRRNKSRNVDISARVELTDDLAIVTHVSVRGSSVKARAVQRGIAKSEARKGGVAPAGAPPRQWRG